MGDYQHIEVRPVTGTLGAEVFGVDMAEDQREAVVSELRRALLENLVIFLRDQKVTAGQQLDFARRFGEPVEYPQLKGLPEAPLITPVVKLEHETRNFGGMWHSDTTYLAEPPMGTMLLAVEVPPFGGDTMFANQYLAYEALSEGLKETLEGLVAVNSSVKAEISRTVEDRMAQAGVERRALYSEHPLVRTHPETGRKALYTSEAHTESIRGWTKEESLALLRFLWRHQVRPEFTCRFRWQPGSLAFWDNRAAMHNPVNDYHGYRRVMHRVTLRGDQPR